MKASPFCLRLIKSSVILFLLLGFHMQVQAQDPLRFEQEVEKITSKYANLALFTGSSSIKMWKDLPSYFPDHYIINAGFGGSQTGDLLHYLDELVLSFKPQKVFIYEGDNDISGGKSTEEIMANTDKIVGKIKEQLPEATVYLISAKPSISRWHLKDRYLELNQQFKEYSQSQENVEYVDVWNIMLDETGNPKTNIFLKDNLHMNKAGYDLWAEVVGKYLN
jgi:lysophospholipase L1-like esterase